MTTVFIGRISMDDCRTVEKNKKVIYQLLVKIEAPVNDYKNA